MSAPSRPRPEYSRGTGASGGPGEAGSGGSGAARAGGKGPPLGRLGTALFAGALAGGLLLIVAEFTTLYTDQIATYHSAPTAAGTGGHDSYAMIPIALLAILMGLAVLRTGSRPALVAIGVAGVVALLIALVGDLPDAHSTGLIAGPSGQYVSAVSTPGAGMYLETSGAVLLLATSGLGVTMLWRPAGQSRS